MCASWIEARRTVQYSIHTKSVLSKKIVTNSFAAARVGKIKGNHKHDEQTGGIKIFLDVFFVTMGSSFKEGFISCRECVSQHDVCGMGFYAKISNHNVDLINGSFLWCKNRQNRARTAHHKRFYRFRHCSACILCVRRVTHLFHLAQFLSSSFRSQCVPAFRMLSLALIVSNERRMQRLALYLN